MSVVAFDTHKFVKRLQDAGFTETQAEAVTQAVQEAASIDLTALATREELKAGLAPLSTKAELRETELRLEAKIEATKSDLLKTIIGAVAFNSAVVLGAMFGLAKLLGH